MTMHIGEGGVYPRLTALRLDLIPSCSNVPRHGEEWLSEHHGCAGDPHECANYLGRYADASC